jgi:hypothetical protein
MDTPTNEYFIEKSRMPVAITLLGGTAMRGSIFILASARLFASLEDAPEFMNAPDPFFPFRRDDGTTILVAKHHVLTMTVDREFAPSSEWTYGERATVEVVMYGGAMHRGDLSLEHYVGHARVLDHMNRYAEPFVMLQQERGVSLLNRQHIAYIHPLDDAAA